jgi:hypothetical protein
VLVAQFLVAALMEEEGVLAEGELALDKLVVQGLAVLGSWFPELVPEKRVQELEALGVAELPVVAFLAAELLLEVLLLEMLLLETLLLVLLLLALLLAPLLARKMCRRDLVMHLRWGVQRYYGCRRGPGTDQHSHAQCWGLICLSHRLPPCSLSQSQPPRHPLQPGEM